MKMSNDWLMFMFLKLKKVKISKLSCLVFQVIRPLAFHRPKALGKLGNIVAETFCFLSMFPSLPTPGNIVTEAKMFPSKFRNIFVAETMFISLPTCFQLEKHFS